MSILIDLIVIAIILFFVILSAKRGFTATVVGVVGSVLAVVIAFSFSGRLAEATYDGLIEPAIISSFIEVSDNSVEDITDDAVEKSIPAFLLKGYEKLGLTTSRLSGMISSNISEGVESAVTTSTRTMVRPVALKILGLIYLFILTILLLMVARVLAKVINKLFSFSIIGKLNRTLGGVIGLVKGVIAAAVFCEIMLLIVSLTTNGVFFFNEANIEKTYLFNLLTKILPFNL